MKAVLTLVPWLFLFSFVTLTAAQGARLEIDSKPFTPEEKSFFARLNPIPWLPKGHRSSIPPPPCEPLELEKMPATAENFQAYLQRCERELNRKEPSGLQALIDISSNQYPTDSNPLVRNVKVRLDNGIVFRGRLGLKPGREARPFVVALCGLFCNGDSAMAATFLMQLFEESPFHVLVLGSPTASNFAADNHIPIFGGYSDGNNLFELVRFLRSPQSGLAPLISSLHLVGQSMGSQGTLFASLRDSRENALGRQRLVQSTIAICPVVDLKGTFDYLKNSNSTTANLIYKEKISAYLRTSYSSIPLLQRRLDLNAQYSLTEYIDIFLQTTVDYYSGYTQTGIHTLNDFWASNDFFSAMPALTTPALVLNADDDFLVSPDANSLRLPAHPYLRLVRFADGSHCGMAVSNGWETLTRMMRSYLLSHSPEYRPAPAREYRLESVAQRGSWLERPPTDSTERVLKVSWQLNSSQRELNLRLLLLNTASAACYSAEDFGCTRVGEYRIPLSLFPELDPMISALDDNAESRILRWAYSNLEARDDQGTPVQQSGNAPTLLRIRGI